MHKFGLLILLIWMLPASAAEHQPAVRIGLTLGVPIGSHAYYERWGGYLAGKTGQNIEFRPLNSCRKAMDLLQAGGIDFAWIEGSCYVEATRRGIAQLMTVPVYRGAPYHRALIIVHRDSPSMRFSDLKGKIFAFSDPDSTTGFTFPLTLVPARERIPGAYFRQSFFTFGHAETVRAVAEQLADGGAVDSYIWEYLASTRPDIAKKTKIIRQSPEFGFSPMVFRRGTTVEMIEKIKGVLESMHKDPVGRDLLAELKLDEFRHFPPNLFNSSRRISIRARTHDLWAATTDID